MVSGKVTPVRRAFFWVLSVLVVTAGAFLFTRSFPQEDSVKLDPTLASAKESGQTRQFSWYQDEEVSNCSQSPLFTRDSAAESRATGVTYNCHRPAKTLAGVIHEVSSAMLLPLASLTFFLGRWRYTLRIPRWRWISICTLIAGAAAIAISWRVPVTAGLASDPVSGAIRVIDPSYAELLMRSLFLVGLGGFVGSLVTISTEQFINRLATQTHILTTPTIAERRRKEE
jgi:hypothetical protein